MAQVDFSHAVLDVNSDSSVKPMSDYGSYMGLGYSGNLYNSGGGQISSGSVSVITETPTKVSLLYAGEFMYGDTEFYMVSNTRRPWKVSNISFSGGDIYSFIIDIEVSGNT